MTTDDDALGPDLRTRLDAVLGPRIWETVEPTDAQGQFPLHESAQPYPVVQWPSLTEIVVRTSIDHGFEDVRIVEAEDDGLVLVGIDPTGASFRFGVGNHVVYRRYPSLAGG